VLTVTSSFPRFRGDYHGGFVYELCRRLSGRGVEVKVLAPRSRTLRPFAAGFDVKRFPYTPSMKLELLAEGTMKDAPPGRLLQLPAYLGSAYAHICALRTDLVHAHFAIPMGFLASIAPSLAPLVITCHGSDCTLPLRSPIYRPFVEKALREADRVVAVCDFIRSLALRLGAPRERTETIYLGVDVKKFKPSKNMGELREAHGIPPDRVVVGTLGRLVGEKRVGDLIEAAPTINRGLDAHFLVGGDGPQRPRLERLSEELGIRNISFLGEVRDAARFHRLCDIFVMPSVSEGLPVSLQEAMATRCVPVAARACGCPELVEDGENGYLFEPGDVADLALKVAEAAENLRMGHRARETVLKRFDIDKNSGRYLEIYRELAEGGSHEAHYL